MAGLIYSVGMGNYQSSPVIKPAEATILRPANPPVRVLVVDDDDNVRHLSAQVLIQSGYRAATAGDGADAWQELQVNSYDLLITDIEMPRMSGVELVKKLRGARVTIPVILASGALPTLELDRNAWLQPVALLLKPFSNGQLLETVNEVLAQPLFYGAKPRILSD